MSEGGTTLDGSNRPRASEGEGPSSLLKYYFSVKKPVIVALTKHMLYQFLSEPDPEKAEKINHQYFGWTGKHPDAREGVVSFLEKREPKWNLKVPGDMPDFFPLKLI